jgi:16S rRNA processing protein RimM
MKPITPPAYLEIGLIKASHGVRGGMRIQVLSDDSSRFLKLTQVYLGQVHTSFRVLEARVLPKQVLLRLDGISTPEAVAPWRGSSVYVAAADALALEPGEYYYHQIIGLTVITEQGEKLGEITDIIPTGSNDVYVVTNEEHEVLLPALKDVVLAIDLGNRHMTVRVPEGLRDGE